MNNLEVGYEITRPTDFDTSDIRSAEEVSSVCEALRTIFINARDYKRGNRGDKVWYNNVSPASD